MEDKERYEMLAEYALEARKSAYSPYSRFRVGAALLTKEGKIYTGCNIENAAYTPSNCAERTAFFKAVSEGERHFEAIAIAGGPEKAGMPLPLCAPCGVCRQVMKEFCGDDFVILLVMSAGKVKKYTLKELFPEGFGPENLA